MLVPGQLITPEIVEALSRYRDYQIEIHGLSEGCIKVLTAEEEETLTNYGYAITDL